MMRIPYLGYLALLGLLSVGIADAAENLSLTKRVVKKGKVSNQSLNVLNKLEQSGTQDSWKTYIEMSANGAKSFHVQFFFKLKSGMNAKKLQELAIQANTKGLKYSKQRVFFNVKNQNTKKWVRLGTNKNSQSWVWNQETFTMTSNGGFSDYFDSQGRMIIQVRSNNKADVVNIDYLAVEASQANTDPDPPSGLWLPKASEGWTWDWQLQGTLDTSLNVGMYDIDLFDTSAAKIQSLHNKGRKVVCYFSAGTYEGWRSDWAEHFDFITGDTYNGNEKPFAGKMAEWDERWLDIREIDLLRDIMTSRLQLAIDKGCDAVEPDNMDAYTNPSETGLDLTYNDQLTYNRWLADLAHELGISIGLKNDVDQLDDLVDYYDWALNEQCFQYSECGGYSSSFLAQDKAVFGVEYSGRAKTFCKKANNMGMSWLKKKLDLGTFRVGCEKFA